MPSPANLTRSDNSSRPGVYEAVVVAGPATIDDPLIAELEGNELPVGPCPWLPRGEDFPVEGDLCWIAFSDKETPVVTAWWPKNNEEALYG